MARTFPPAIVRFEDAYIPVPESGCWIWTKCLDKGGYSKFQVDGKVVRAHRFSYEYFNGPIPEGMSIDHLCRVRSCVNPKHLEAVTGRENLIRGNGFSGRNHRKTHCVNGHPLNGENLYTHRTPTGVGRQCIKCRRIRGGVKTPRKRKVLAA